MIRLLTNSAAMSLPVRESPARPADAYVGGAGTAGARSVEAGLGALGTTHERGFELLAASRWTVLRLTFMPMSASASRIASHV